MLGCLLGFIKSSDDEFVNDALVKESSNDLTATHHPDVLTLHFAQPFGERTNGGSGAIFREKAD